MRHQHGVLIVIFAATLAYLLAVYLFGPAGLGVVHTSFLP